MKRFYVAAAIAASLLATSCQKTYVIDEVRTPIGFSTEVGKQTKAIIKSGTAYNDQDFGVFAYGVVGTPGENNTVTDGAWNSSFNITEQNTVMNNVKITKSSSSAEWKAATGTYYWPNDAHTTLSFFAYSPYSKKADNSAESAVAAEGMGVTPTFSAANGIQLTDYTHVNYQGTEAVDFMVAETLNQKYSGTTGTTNGKVDIKFNHKMTQIVFTVAKASDLDGIEMKLKSLSLNKVNNKADFSVTGGWKNQSGQGTYSLFAATSDSYQDFSTSPYSTTPVTMIPQDLGTQEFEIKYSISGDGLANEDVTKTITIPTTPLSWGANQKITYKITIGMKQITFNPTVVDWNEYDSNESTSNVKDPVDIKI